MQEGILSQSIDGQKEISSHSIHIQDMELLRMAKEARNRAYAPYSGFMVGAALLAEGGRIYCGCNIENAAYTPTNCAERTAFFQAVYQGERRFIKIAIAGAKQGEEAETPCAPCGVCRQVMMEFCDPEKFEIILADQQQGCRSYLLKELFPYGFGPQNLEA